MILGLWNRSIRRYGALEEVIGNDFRLLEFCVVRDLEVTGTYFQHKTMSTSNRKDSYNHIDLILAGEKVENVDNFVY